MGDQDQDINTMAINKRLDGIRKDDDDKDKAKFFRKGFADETSGGSEGDVRRFVGQSKSKPQAAPIPESEGSNPGFGEKGFSFGIKKKTYPSN